MRVDAGAEGRGQRQGQRVVEAGKEGRGQRQGQGKTWGQRVEVRVRWSEEKHGMASQDK